jgi:hypothetical protein
MKFTEKELGYLQDAAVMAWESAEATVNGEVEKDLQELVGKIRVEQVRRRLSEPSHWDAVMNDKVHDMIAEVVVTTYEQLGVVVSKVADDKRDEVYKAAYEGAAKYLSRCKESVGE